MFLTWLARAARTVGVPVVEVNGWQSRGHGPMALAEGVVGHHTGTPRTLLGDYPSLAGVRDGRAGLPGPLSHYGLGRNGTIYVIASGRCYHAGASAHAGFTELNDKFVGIEAESAGAGDWTNVQREVYPKLVGAALHAMGRSVSRYCSHRTCALPAGRKPDPTGLSDLWMREQAQAFMNTLGKPDPPAGPTPPPSPVPLPTLRQGDSGPNVIALHLWLTHKYRWAADMFQPTGYYGPITVQAMAEFQRRTGVTGPDANGTIIGERTKAALWIEGYRG